MTGVVLESVTEAVADLEDQVVVGVNDKGEVTVRVVALGATTRRARRVIVDMLRERLSPHHVIVSSGARTITVLPRVEAQE